MSKKSKSASKSASSSRTSKSEKSTSKMSNQTTWIIIIVAVLVVVVLLSIIGNDEKSGPEVSSTIPSNNAQLAPIVSPLPSPLASAIPTTSGVAQSDDTEPGWKLSFNGTTAFGLSINAGINDKGQLYIDPTFQSNIFSLLNRNASSSATPRN